MSAVRVDALDLKLVAPAAMRPAGDALKSRAEGRFMPAVLTAMQKRLSRAYGESAIIRIRALKIRCGMRPSELDEARFAEVIGEELASIVEQLVVRERGAGPLPSVSAEAQVYRDAAHLEAAELIAAAARSPGPSGGRRDFGRLWSQLAREKPDHVEAVLVRCHEAEELDLVLSRLDGRALAALDPIVARSRVAGLAAAVRRARAALRAAAASEETRKSGAPPAAASDEAPRPPARSRKEGGPARRPAAKPASPEPDEEAALPDAEVPPDRPRQRVRREATRNGEAVVRPAQEASSDVETPAPRRIHGTPAMPIAEPPAPAPPGDAPEALEDEPGEVASWSSEWCALLYLVNVSQRLELPERLWQIGVDEGAVLASIFARLADSDEDPAPRLLSAAFPEAPPPISLVPDWARDEVRTGALDAAARLLGAPVEPLRARIADLEAFYSAGPEFDIAAWGAACHLAVAEAMLGRTLAPGAIAELFARPGRIEADDNAFRVIQPLAAIDLDMRRAGLDLDPGLLPWLDRRLLFLFEGDEE